MAHQRLKPESLMASPSYQYGSVPASEDEFSALISSKDSDVLADRTSASCRRCTCSRVAVMFCSTVAVGMLLWIGTASLELSPDHYAGFDDDDDNASILSSLTITDLLRSQSSNAKKEAKRARDFLNLDDAKNNREVLASQGSDARHEIQEQTATGCEGTVLIMRHCEKGYIREHCNYIGYERSAYLASLFGNEKGNRWPAPSYLVAESPDQRRNPNKKNFRELETVLPLSEKFNVTVDSSYSVLDTIKLARHIQELLRSGEMCGKLMVISWKHSKLPRLAHALGCGPRQGCPVHYRGRDFDSLWQLKFLYQKPLHSSSKHLKPVKDRQWTVFGSVQAEEFDPLAFSKRVGDYPSGGTGAGGRWRTFDNEIPERDVLARANHKKQKEKKVSKKEEKKKVGEKENKDGEKEAM